MGFGHAVRWRRFLGRLVLLRCGQYERTAIGAHWSCAAISETIWSLVQVSRVYIEQPRPGLRTDLQAARETSAVAAVQNHGETDAFIESYVEEARHLEIEDIVGSQPGIRRHQRVVSVHTLDIHRSRKLGRLAVSAQRPMTGVIEHDRVAAGR